MCRPMEEVCLMTRWRRRNRVSPNTTSVKDILHQLCMNHTLGTCITIRFRPNLKHCPQNMKELTYFSLPVVWSKSEYASNLWDPYLIKDKKLIEYTQCRAARFVTNTQARPGSNMFKALGWSLEARRQEGRINMFSNIVHKDIYCGWFTLNTFCHFQCLLIYAHSNNVLIDVF